MTMTIMGLAAGAASAQGFLELSSYSQEMDVAGYRVESLYLDAGKEPMGARYTHPNGMKVDILRFASVPQVSVTFGTPPSSNKGEPHAQEHLLLGKGKAGKFFNAMLGMAMGEMGAATHSELTHYHFNAVGSRDGFYGLLEAFFRALIRPDYTDEEIRREVAHIGAERDPESGKYALAEKGTVYLEMLSSMEKVDHVSWKQLGPPLFGPRHPLALMQGGLPEDIRTLAAEDIRSFHQAHYHFGSNMHLVAALPGAYSPREFLEKLNSLMGAIEPEAVSAKPGCRPSSGEECVAYALLADAAPAQDAPIVLGGFPSKDASLPQSATFAWKPVAGMPSARERLELALFLDVFAGGDASLLHKDMVGENARILKTGASGVGAYYYQEPAKVPMIFFTGLGREKVTRENLELMREAVLARVKEIRKAGKRSQLLGETNRKALALLSSWRRGVLKFVDAPPGFGSRQTGTGWHKHLDRLAGEKGFRKDLLFRDVYADLERDLRKGLNVWKGVVKRARLEEAMIVSAVLPDPELLDADRAAGQSRLKSAAEEIKKRFNLREEQEAFAALMQEQERGTRALDERDAAIDYPPFTSNPPLTLDDEADVVVAEIGGVPALISRFPSTPFTDLYFNFDLRGVPKEDWTYLPALEMLVLSLGATTADGKRLEFAEFEEAWTSEIYAMGAGVSSDRLSGRQEFSVSVSGAAPEENAKAIVWLETVLLRPNADAPVLSRLRDVLKREIKAYREMTQGREEDWAPLVAQAYTRQDDAQWMILRSPLTRLDVLNRLYFRFSGYPDEKTKRLVETILDDLAGEAKTGTPERMKDRLHRLASGAGLPKTLPASVFLEDFGAYFDAEYAKMPEATWRRDMERLIRRTKEDIAADPAAEIAKLRGVFSEVVTRRNLRIAMTGSPSDTEALRPAAAKLAGKLPPGKSAGKDASRGEGLVLKRLRERYPDIRSLPVHAALPNPDSKSGVVAVYADGPSYADAGRDAALDYLAALAFSGAGPHSFYMKTWAAGLAYGNGVAPGARGGRLYYYAERCVDLPATLRFVSGLPVSALPADKALVEYALAGAFGDYRAAGTFSSRGAAAADDVADGVTPEIVRAFKASVLEAARSEGAAGEIKKRLPRVLGSVLPGYGVKVSQAKGAFAFAIGAEPVLRAYEDYLKFAGEAQSLIRLYPRDFWIME